MISRRGVFVLAFLAALGVAVPQERVFADTRHQEELLRQRQQEELMRQRLETQARSNVAWSFKVVNAHTFVQIYSHTLLARNVTCPEEAKWDIRTQLGFPVDSDQRTVGGVPQLIIWLELNPQARTAATEPAPPPAPAAALPLPIPLPLPPIAAPRIPSPRREPAAEQRARRNWFSAEASLLGGGIRLERSINNFFTLGGTAWVDRNTFQYRRTTFGVMGTPRLFVGGSPFYFELGLGLGSASWWETNEVWVPGTPAWGGGGGTSGRFEWQTTRESTTGPMVTPAIGLRLGGRTRAFFVNPYVSLPIVIGAPVSVRAGVGLGGAW
ncbi:MAG: hypothetical protein FWB79_01660 [Treponema sp.]|nr:hypothetical protein [Treponema sp.]